MSGQRKAILVLGMHRSGTSAVSGSLSLAGIPLGSDLLAPGEDNPKGYFEHAEAVRIDDALLDALDRRWDDIRPMPPKWEKSAEAEASIKALRNWLAREFAGQPVFAVKDPRMCRLLPVWLAALEAEGIEPLALLVARPPAEVAASIGRRNGWPVAASETLWLGHMLDAERDSRSLQRAVLTYDQLLQEPTASIARVLGELDLPDAALRASRVDDAGFVSADDRHHVGLQEASGDGALGQLAVQVYRGFARMADGETVAAAEFDGWQAGFAGIMQPCNAHIEALSQMALAFRRQTEAAHGDLAGVRSELIAQQDWAKTAVAEREILQADLAGTRSELLAQQDWAKAAVAEREALQADLAGVRSELTAQQDWAKTAVAEREALQADLAAVRSELLAQQDWSKAAVAEREALQAELAGVRSELLAQQDWSKAAVAERETLQAELAGVRSELLAQQDWSKSAVTEREALQAELAEAVSRLNAQLDWSAEAVRKQDATYAELASVYAQRDEVAEALATLRGHVAEMEATRDGLQSRLDDINATLAGRMLGRWLDRRANTDPRVD